MDFSRTPILEQLTPDERAEVLALARPYACAAGATICAEGDPADWLYLVERGTCMLSRHAQPLEQARPGALIDLAAALGGLGHTLRAIAMTDCHLLRWQTEDVWRCEPFAAAARRWLAASFLQAQARADELAAPLHYLHDRAELLPGPFVFNNTTLVIALCEADLDPARALLPEGLSLFRRMGRRRDSLFLALARFPQAFPESAPSARFSYTETTCFIPVRYGTSFGLFPLYIYPSAWEPILLGREIYGFAKRLGSTTLDERGAALAVDGRDFFRLDYAGPESSSEARLVRALSDWVGFEGRAAAAAFRAGEALRAALRLPAYRRVDVYNHKRIPAAGATRDKPVCDVDCLTHAVFGVLRWHEIKRMRDAALMVTGGPLADARPVLTEVFYTRLDMRLSAGQVAQDYLQRE